MSKADYSDLMTALMEDWTKLEEEHRKLEEEHRRMIEKQLEHLRVTYSQLMRLMKDAPGAAASPIAQVSSLPTSCYHVLRTVVQEPSKTLRMRDLHNKITEYRGPDYDKSTLSDAVRRLCEAGLIKKTKDHEGGRRSKWMISLSGPLPRSIVDQFPPDLQKKARS